MSKNTPVDWTKPVQRSVYDSEKWVDVEVLKVHRDGTATLYDPQTDTTYTRVGPEFCTVRNTPPAPPAWATPGLRVEVGKAYRTRSGKKAIVTAYRPDHNFLYACEVDGKPRMTVTPYGTVWRKSCGASGCDLVAEWKDPKPFDIWVNVYPQTTISHSTVEAADHAASKTRIARVHVSFDGESAKCNVETF